MTIWDDINSQNVTIQFHNFIKNGIELANPEFGHWLIEQIGNSSG